MLHWNGGESRKEEKVKKRKGFSIEKLVYAAKTGDTQAFKQLFYEHHPVVWKLKQRYHLHGFDVDDWLQEGRIICYQSLQKFDQTKQVTFGSFFKHNLKNHICSLLRKQEAFKRKIHQETTSLEEKIEHVGETFYDQLHLTNEDHDDQLIIQEQLETFYLALSSFEMNVLVYYQQNFSTIEISEKLDISVSSVQNAIQRIRRKLKDQFRR